MWPTSPARRSAKKAAAAMSLLLLSCFLTSCGDSSTRSATGSVDPEARVRFAIQAPPTQLDPLKTTNEVRDNTYFAPLFDRLTTVTYDKKISPQLAESWDTAKDGLTWTFHLRQGATFHDGSPVDAEAVVANLERAFAARDSNAFVATKLSDVVGFEAVDEATVSIELDEPKPGLAASLAAPTMSISSPAAFDTLGATPVGSGPFKFVSQAADRIVYTRYDDYWDQDRARSADLEVLGIPDGTARLNAVRAGQVDATITTLDLAYQIKAMASDSSFTVVGAEPQSVLTIYLNSTHPPLDDVRVRRALNYAVDRDSINKNLLEGLCTPTTQPFPSGPGQVEELDDAYTYDPDKAAELLKEAGVDNLKLETIILDTSLSKAVSPALQDQMKQAGVTLDLKSTNAPDARPLFREGNGDTMISQINGEADPALMLGSNFLGPDNPGGLSPELTQIVERAIQTPVDSDERTRALEEISAKVVESPEHIHICGISDHFVGSSSVVGIDEMPWLGIITNPDPSGLGRAN